MLCHLLLGRICRRGQLNRYRLLAHQKRAVLLARRRGWSQSAGALLREEGDVLLCGCPHNPLLYLIISHINPEHTVITHLFTISCNHLILIICWNILNYLKFEILTVPCISVLNRFLSMLGSQNVLPFCLQLNLFMLFLPPFTAIWT